MKILVVRHGESEMNISGLVQGKLSDLTPAGRAQAARLANRLKEEQIDLAFVSPLDRAKQTAEIVLVNHPETRVTFTDKLREKAVGVFEGRPSEEMRQAWQDSGLPFGEFKPEGGESWYQAGERVVGFIEELVTQYKSTDYTVLVVGHGSIFTYLLMWADKFNPKHTDKDRYDYYHPDNTAMAVIEVDRSGQVQLVSLNDTAHLE